ncbi:MAG: formate--tetrahydrofolate ligase [Clostridiales bacterium]|nr:formate--tetrahydrofolate ligase [Clostridiales bacterium]
MIKDIKQVAKKLKINSKDMFCYGNNIAKINIDQNVDNNKINNSKLILVTAMTSNKSGIGKTTVSIGLADALNKLGKNVCLALREPSLGPVFGIKGGATGGGKSQVYPSDEINLHFTGDFHAIAQANNLLCSILDNHMFFGNALKIDPKKIFIKRCLDINERSLRDISYKIKDYTIKTGFNITAASEVMAILCLSENLDVLKQNLGNILVALDISGNPIYARDLNAQESMTILLKDAIKPNLVQTLDGTPAFVHLGPFANIAHGCNSITATKQALKYADYVVTEAGFGSDLGAEKFLNIKTRELNKTPDAVVLVVTISVVKEHGDGDLLKGFENVKKHIHNLTTVFGLNTVVAINVHKQDTQKEINQITKLIEAMGVKVRKAQGFAKGASGCLELANLVIENAKNPTKMNYVYEMTDSIEAKIEKIAQKVYGAKKVKYSKKAKQQLALIHQFGFDKFYVNMAKTQFSFSGDKSLLGAPKNFTLTIDDIEIRSGAKMIVAIAGKMLLMPGLGKNSNYNNMIIRSYGKIDGLF